MKIIHISFLSFFIFFGACKDNPSSETKEKEKDGQALSTTFSNPVLPGDFADPSVVRVGEDYYATATSSEWAPLYPILHSTNLVNWEIIGHVFPENLPDWAEANFWAPEIMYEDGKFYVYYTARKKDGPLCTAVASATNPEGPYTDHGALVCQDIGAIDGFAIRDENEDLFLIWKEDGNSQGKPTPIWGQQMNEERTELLGEKFELFRNDPGTWEGNLVEGAFILRREGYYYAFYSGDRCCGRECTYGVGVARAKKLQGPWEKYEENPLMKQNEEWKCAGHGSVVTDEEGNYYFLYHAYNTDGTVYTGRQGLLDRIVWQEDGWPRFADNAPSNKAEIDFEVKEQDLNVEDDFQGDKLTNTWQWPVGQKPSYTFSGGGLSLKALPEDIGAVLAQRTLTTDYTATLVLDRRDLDPETRAGLAAIGDKQKAVGIALLNGKVVLWQDKGKEKKIIAETEAPNYQNIIELKLTTKDGDQMEFSWKNAEGQWESLNEQNLIDAAYLPPWDRAVRVGLTVKGPENSEAVFRSFSLNEN